MTSDFVTGPAPSRPLGVFRAAVGVAALAKALDLGALVVAGKGATSSHRALWLLVVAIWALAAAALLGGYHSRAAAGGIAVLTALFIRGADLYSNHFYLLGTFALLLTLADSGAAFSLDARRRGVREEVPAWPVRLIQLQVSVVYAFSALGKVNASFLAGNVLFYQSDQALLVPDWARLTSVPVFVALSVGAVLLELFVAVGLWVPSLRSRAFTCGLVLHLGMIAAISTSPAVMLRLMIFALLVLCAYVLFIPVTPRSLLVWEGGDGASRRIRWVPRLDWLGAVRTGPGDPATEGLWLRDAEGEVFQGWDAAERVLAVLPLTALWAPVMRSRLLRKIGRHRCRAVGARGRPVADP